MDCYLEYFYSLLFNVNNVIDLHFHNVMLSFYSQPKDVHLTFESNALNIMTYKLYINYEMIPHLHVTKDHL